MTPDEMRAEAERLQRKADDLLIALQGRGQAAAVRAARLEASLWAVGAEIVERLERDSKARFYDGESE